MAFTVHPIGSATGFAEQSELDSELDRLISGLGGRMADFVVSPFGGGDFDLTTSGSSYDVDVAPGDAFVGGHFVQSDTVVTITVDGSATNEVFLVVDDAQTGNAAIEYTSDGSDPPGQHVVKLHEVTTDGSGVTGTTDFRPYVAFPDLQPDESITGKKETPQGTPDPPSVSTESTGVVTVTVTFDRPYRDRIDSVVASLDNLTDTAVNFGWTRTKNVTVDSFDIEVKVTKAGASGSTAEFHWVAHGK